MTTYNTVKPLTTSSLNTLQQASIGATVGGLLNPNSGKFLTTGANGTSWANLSDNVVVAKTNPPELEVKGRMVINGVDLEERLNTIEKVLCIPERDVILEQKHPKLKKLYDEYINELSKYRMWESIKGDQ